MNDFTGKLVRIVSPKGNAYPNDHCDYFSTCVQYLVKRDLTVNGSDILLDVETDEGLVTSVLIGYHGCAHLVDGDYWEIL